MLHWRGRWARINENCSQSDTMKFGRGKWHTDAASRSSLRPEEERESCDNCQRLATKDVPYPHGSDEGILFLSPPTVVAVVSISVSVSVEGSMVCKTISLSLRDNWRDNRKFTIVINRSSVTFARLRTAASASLDHFKPTPVPKGLCLAALRL